MSNHLLTYSFLILSFLLFNIGTYFVPKRISKIEVHATGLFYMIIELLLELFLIKKLDWYGYFHAPIQWIQLFVIFGMYGAGVLIINAYPFHKGFMSKAFYYVYMTAFWTFYEWLAVKAGMLNYHHWKILYSAIVYPFLFYLGIAHIYLIRRLLK
ncbi:hypothetical protein BpJC7_13990 [Weizmannia acidilactici]|uniref:Uncharacterized protein n=1 Tax=Weizmannia acidilactici TaxID=2607726 RepID=A0A5J4J594_9BACI|nr:CBO0543 family protein [Weizmannia acidilactici]GER66843.1 hypothetical protein BpJC4_13140 [Weizmannia acidilactici]GER70096.1 hypothetical protein BpJC7_13990 [Weizmannia acidilactici]